MVSRFGAFGFAVAVCLSVAAPALAQSASDKETARSLMDQGFDLRNHGDLNGALARFKAANAIMHVPTTALEVAHTQVALGRLVEARDTLAQIMTSVPSPGEPHQFRTARAEAQTLDASLEARVPAVTVTVTGAAGGAPVGLSVDGVAVPAAVIGLPRRLDPGHHVFVATTSTQEGRAEIDVAEGDKKDVSITLATVAKPAPPPPVHEETPPPVPESHRSYALPIVFFTVGGVGLVAGAITGAIELSQQSSLSTNCPNHVCPPSQYSALDGANVLATISTVAVIVGGAGLVGGVITLLVGGKSSAPAPTEARVEPWIGLGSAGIRGTF
jgi:hypothetical protein